MTFNVYQIARQFGPSIFGEIKIFIVCFLIKTSALSAVISRYRSITVISTEYNYAGSRRADPES